MIFKLGDFMKNAEKILVEYLSYKDFNIDVNNITFQKDNFKKWIMAYFHYSDRTASNHVRPSHKGGIIFYLLDRGLVKKRGFNFFEVPDVKKLKASANQQKKTIVRKYAGNKPDGNSWMDGGRMSDEDYPIEFLCSWCKKQEFTNVKIYAKGTCSRKANFWVTFKDEKLIEGRDAILLREHHPSVFNNLMSDFEAGCFV